jgi:hypothetical protein
MSNYIYDFSGNFFVGVVAREEPPEEDKDEEVIYINKRGFSSDF